MSLISAGSISLDSTFKPKSYDEIQQARSLDKFKMELIYKLWVRGFVGNASNRLAKVQKNFLENCLT